MDLTKPSELKRLLAKHGLTLSKRFGQNFLVERAHLMRVVETSAVGSFGTNDRAGDRVMEIGPGAGVLTVELAERAERVAAIELDRQLLPVLAESLANFTNVQVVQADALKLDLPAFVGEFLPGDGLCRVVANIPYNITSPILIKLLDDKALFASITLMVQKEVAKRLVAPPDGDDYGALSVFAQFHAHVTLAAIVPRGAFFPPPKVDSAVIHLVPRLSPPVDIRSEAEFFGVSRAAFGQRRKTLFNALTNAPRLPFTRAEIGDALALAGVDGNRRGETLTLDELAAVSRALPFDNYNGAAVQ